VAKILGPRGKMPNPKDGTVVDKPEDAIADLSENTARYRADVGRNIHVAVGKISWDKGKLSENIQTVIKALAHLKKSSVTLSTSMSPGIKLVQ
jgi:large subunit ribosomal protein L1